MYGCECWCLKKDERRLCTEEMSWFRRILGETRTDRIKNKVTRDERDQNETILNRIKQKGSHGMVMCPGWMTRDCNNKSTSLSHTRRTQTRKNTKEMDGQYRRRHQGFMTKAKAVHTSRDRIKMWQPHRQPVADGREKRKKMKRLYVLYSTKRSFVQLRSSSFTGGGGVVGFAFLALKIIFKWIWTKLGQHIEDIFAHHDFLASG